jgi:hypothetical protein
MHFCIVSNSIKLLSMVPSKTPHADDESRRHQERVEATLAWSPKYEPKVDLCVNSDVTQKDFL